MYFSAVIYHGGVYITSACTFSTMHNNIHLCFTLLVTLAFHSYWSRVFHPCQMVPRFQSPRLSINQSINLFVMKHSTCDMEQPG